MTIEDTLTRVETKLDHLLSKADNGPQPEVLDREDVAKLLDCSISTITRLEKAGKLNRLAAFGQPRYNREAVKQLATEV